MYDKQLDSGRGTLLHLCDDVIQQEVSSILIFPFIVYLHFTREVWKNKIACFLELLLVQVCLLTKSEKSGGTCVAIG